MQDNVIERLRAKEEEMEAMVAAARVRAASIREEALKKAVEARSSGFSALEDELKCLCDEFDSRLKAEIAGIEKDADLQAMRIKEEGEKRMDAALGRAVEIIIGGVDRR